MGFLDKFKKKSQESNSESSSDSSTQASTGQKSSPTTAQSQGKRIKKYTSDGKPIYE